MQFCQIFDIPRRKINLSVQCLLVQHILNSYILLVCMNDGILFQDKNASLVTRH